MDAKHSPPISAICSIGILLFPEPAIRIVGGHRVEIRCTRQVAHPIEGPHWYDDGVVRIEWSVAPDAVWMAGDAST